MYLLALRKSATRNLAYYGAGITMRNRFMKSSIVKKRVKKYAKKAYKSKSKKYSKVEKVNFKGYTNIDLHLSIGHANYFKVAVVQKSAILGTVNFEVTISVKDIYDFKKMNKKDQNIIIVAVNNYLGYKPQSKGIIKKYNWKYTTKYHASFWKKELK